MLNLENKVAVQKLHAAGIKNAAREWMMICEHFEGSAREDALNRRIAREPMSHILGYRDFWNDRFFVNANVLDPRPDSELFLEIIEKGPDPAQILDLGCGSGALGISAKKMFPKAELTLADISSEALSVAKKNAQEMNISAQFILGNWFEGVQYKFDLILSNPPYITEEEMKFLDVELQYEPKIALSPGGDGLGSYRLIAINLEKHLAVNGRALFEHGHRQAEQVAAIFQHYGFSTKVHLDWNEKPRITEVNLSA